MIYCPRPPPTPADGALAQCRRFPATATPLVFYTHSLTSAVPSALLLAEVQRGLSRSQLHLLVGAVLETTEKEAAAAALSLHPASASRSAGDSQPSPSPALGS